MTTDLHVFISSKMQELAPEREALRRLLSEVGHELVTLRAWTFEADAPAADRSIREVYLDALKQSALYVGLFWNEYGEWTIDEFERASEWAIDRHIYVKDVEPERRDPRLTAFLEAQSDVITGITPKWFRTPDELAAQVRHSLEVWLQDRLARRPGAASAILADEAEEVPNLPRRLIGRKAMIGRTRALLEDGGRVLLQGFSGMGKSALAATVAADWIDAGEGAALWLHAGSEPARSMCEALARPLGGQPAVASAADAERPKVLRRLLADSDVSLLVLDDVWDGAALFEVLKAVPRRMSVLVTSQHRYALDDILEVRRLEPDDARAALAYYAGTTGEPDPAADELCRQLGYHAFALEVAGKMLKVDQIATSELLRRIATAPHALAMPGAFAEEGRTSITELLNASLYALDEPVRAVFLAFGVLFTPGASVELMARLMDRDEAAVADALTVLHRRGLAERQAAGDGVTVYRVHDLAYSYAATIAARQGRDRRAVIAACHAYTLAHANEVGAIDAEIGNLLGAAEHAAQIEEGAALVETMLALCGPYLATRGHSLAFLSRLDAAIDAAAALGSDHDEARHTLLGKRGNTYYDRGDLPRALDAYQQALDLARKLERPDREALLLCAVGKVRADQGTDDATAHFDAAYQIAQAQDDGFLRAFVLEHQGYYAQARGDYEAARGYFAEEAALAEQMDDPEAHFFALLNLGSAEHVLGQYADALDHHQRALAIAEAHDNRIYRAHALQSMGEDHHRLDDHIAARECLDRALALFRESGMHAKADEVAAYMRSANYPVD